MSKIITNLVNSNYSICGGICPKNTTDYDIIPLEMQNKTKDGFINVKFLSCKFLCIKKKAVSVLAKKNKYYKDKKHKKCDNYYSLFDPIIKNNEYYDYQHAFCMRCLDSGLFIYAYLFSSINITHNNTLYGNYSKSKSIDLSIT